VAVATGSIGFSDLLAGTQRVQPWRWTGSALGARASIVIHHHDRGEARRLVGACLSEVQRLEKVFSLYRTDSALSALNRDGELDAPPFELVELLSTANALSARTDGAFDVSVQPLWSLYREYFSHPGRSDGGPPDRAIEVARRAVDREAVSIAASRIRLRRPSMALTLNGIAQGFITDRVSALLQRAGLDSVLLDLGEVRTLGLRPGDRPWRVDLPGQEGEQGRVDLLLEESAAVATSAPDAYVFEPSGRHHHLFDPGSGRSLSHHAAVTVIAPTATQADALSTAFAVMDRAAIARVTASLGSVRVRLLQADGSVSWIG
jgi:thiamine biosynthesis lipoprotein